jgi:hypothetical protein
MFEQFSIFKNVNFLRFNWIKFHKICSKSSVSLSDTYFIHCNWFWTPPALLKSCFQLCTKIYKSCLGCLLGWFNHKLFVPEPGSTKLFKSAAWCIQMHLSLNLVVLTCYTCLSVLRWVLSKRKVYTTLLKSRI